MESGRRNFIMGYDPLGLGGGTFMESGRRNFIMGHKRGCFWGSPYMREEVERGETRARGGREGGERGTEGQRKSDHGIRPFRVGGGTFRGRRNFIMGYDPLGWGGEHHGIRKKQFYHGIRPFRVGREDAHGIWKKKNYHGTQEGVLLGGPPI